MARPSEKALEYRERSRQLSWEDLRLLWESVVAGVTPDWDDGKALEHLVVRAFELGGLRVEYPYDVPLAGRPLEQIDGLAYLGEYAFLLECKDRDKADIEVIAKLHHQLLRRPLTAFEAVFVTGEFTQPALVLAGFSIPPRIVLWSRADIDAALAARDFAGALRAKYEQLCKYGLPDYLPDYRELEYEA